MSDEEKVVEEIKVTPKKQPKVILSPKHYESRQRAHDMKVAKFLSGGKF